MNGRIVRPFAKNADKGGQGMKSPLRMVAGLSMMVWVAFFFPVMAGASVYDDFTGPGIDGGKWSVTGSGFTAPGDGFLHYSGSTPVKEKITSTALFTSGIFTMPFTDYSSDNSAPPARGLGSVAALGLGAQSTNAWVRIERGQVTDDPAHGIIGGYIEVNWMLPSNPGKIYVNYVKSDITAGTLQLRYDGAKVTFFYRNRDSDPWTQMVVTGQGGKPVLDGEGRTQPLVITPGWTEAVPIFIQAIPGGDDSTPSYQLSFKVDRVRVDRLPLESLRDTVIAINGLERNCFRNPNRQRVLAAKVGKVEEKTEEGLYLDALEKLERDILSKTDGCAVGKRPDRNDWITDCEAQGEVYPLITEAISSLEQML